MNILDCTFRDGGYYTDWDFPRNFVRTYIEAINTLPVDIIEVGYRSSVGGDYKGEFYYCPLATLKDLRQRIDKHKKIACMVNSKEISSSKEMYRLLKGCKGLVDIFRFAVSPENLESSLEFCSIVKQEGYNVAINLMYLSKLSIDEDLCSKISSSCLDYVYFVDSYGACYPEEIRTKISEARRLLPSNVSIGFHGHDNLLLAFANSLVALDSGASVIDCTLTGMGRGAGNLQTELFSAHKAKIIGCSIDYDVVAVALDYLTKMKQQKGWGSSLPYILTGVNSLPQQFVMDLISKRRYSTSTIIELLERDSRIPPAGIASSSHDIKISYENFILVGGGNSVINHFVGISEYIRVTGSLPVLTSLKHIELFEHSGIEYAVCLPGDEVRRSVDIEHKNIVACFVSERGASQIIPCLSGKTQAVVWESAVNGELGVKLESPLMLGVGALRTLGATSYYAVGFDGYDSYREFDKAIEEETQECFDWCKMNGHEVTSLTPTSYKVDQKSLYFSIV